MEKRLKIPARTRTRLQRTGIIMSILLSCVLVLSACNGNEAPGDKARTLASKQLAAQKRIDGILIQQGQQQIQTFQLWIGLMHQYKGDISQYQQELTRSQQALSAAKTTGAYQSALKTLNT